MEKAILHNFTSYLTHEIAADTSLITYRIIINVKDDIASFTFV